MPDPDTFGWLEVERLGVIMRWLSGVHYLGGSWMVFGRSPTKVLGGL